MNYAFITDFVFWTDCENHQQIKNATVPAILKNLDCTVDTNQWTCKVNTEFFTKSDRIVDYGTLLKQGVFPALDAMFSEMTFLRMPTQSRVREIWYNYYSPGGNQEVHAHGHDGISGIYFLHLEEPNTTVFYSDQANKMMSFVNNVKHMSEIREGQIVLFPSHLLHYVAPCVQDRITVSFNIDCDFSN